MSGYSYEPPASQQSSNPYETQPYPAYPAYGQPQAYPAQPGGYATQPYGQPMPNPYAVYQVGPMHPQGTVILVLGICGFVSMGITGLIAWIMGRKALKEIDGSGLPYSNRGQVQAGFVLGIVTTILGGLYVLFWIGYIIFFVVMLGAIGVSQP